MDAATNDDRSTTDAQSVEYRALREHGFTEALAAAAAVEATKVALIHYGGKLIHKKSEPNDDAKGEDD